METRSAEDIVYIYKLEIDHEPTPEDMAESAYQILKAAAPPVKENVVIKPNVTIATEPDSGIITHPDFVGGIVDYFRDMGIPAEKITIAEGGGSGKPSCDMAKQFEQTGYTAMTRARSVKLVNLNWDESVRIRHPQAEILEEIGIAKTVRQEHTTFINVPKFKTHNLAVTTLSVKNLMGTITPCEERHLCSIEKEYAARQNEITENGIELREERLCRKLCDLLLASRTDLNVIEGIIGRDGTGFRHGKNIQTNLAIAGMHQLAVDATGSYLMGFEPANIGYLKIAAQRGIGNIDVQRMKILKAADGELVPCEDISEFMSPVPFKVLRWDQLVRDIPLTKDMQARLPAAVSH